ncbi:hypothetical protein CY35_05G084300 [Sphagnum magellanicum]|nr:hypothetical protein CY35_05G084300 [Sphagnum magellanicum]
MRRRSPSYSPPRRRRSPSPRGRRGYNRGVDLPTSLLVRNIPRDCRTEDLRIPFERYGVIKDVYLPKDYYTGELRGFGFVQFLEAGDAAEAQYNMDHQLIGGREITVVFAEENRKKPQEMRLKERTRGHQGYGRRHSPYTGPRSRSPRHRSPSSRAAHHSRSYSPERGYHHSYTPSPLPYHDGYSSPVRSNSRRERDRSPLPTRSSPSPPQTSRDYQPHSNGRDHYPERRQRSPSHSPPSSHRHGREVNYERSPVLEHRRTRHSGDH